MSIHRWLALAAIFGLSGPACSAAEPEKQPLQTVNTVDLARYAGTWYEIARYPNRFQRDCAGDVTALYEVRPDGSVRFTSSYGLTEASPTCFNAFVDDTMDRRLTSVGTLMPHASAKVVDRTTNAKLKVTFFWPFSGDYWIINLGPNYEYAVVGEPGRDYLWILSRTPQMDEATYNVLLERIARQGYDPGRLVKTPQSAR